MDLAAGTALLSSAVTEIIPSLKVNGMYDCADGAIVRLRKKLDQVQR